MSSLFDLSGRVALVTGGNGGIGRGIALGLAQAGADIVVAARNQEKNAAVAEELRAVGRGCATVTCDVQDRAQVEEAVRTAEREFGRLDILVNNAGVAGGGRPEDIPMDVWHRVLHTNLTAMFEACQVAHPRLKASGGGKIINIGSEYSLFGSARALPYSASKGGVVQLTKSLAASWAGDNIQVNAIVPGWITTDMTEGVKSNQAFYDQIIARTPARRFGQPEDMAGAAVFLASAASNFVTGVVLPVDGGYAAS